MQHDHILKKWSFGLKPNPRSPPIDSDPDLQTEILFYVLYDFIFFSIFLLIYRHRAIIPHSENVVDFSFREIQKSKVVFTL